MQYTIRNVPAEVDSAVRRFAQSAGLSLNEAVKAMLRNAANVTELPRRRDLSDIVGSWQDDPEFDKIILEQSTIDPSMW